jgi:beta-lactam-binding protein with PASTA domain
MPELLGASYEVAAATLQRLGLHAVPQPIASELDEAGVVLATDPAPARRSGPGARCG